MFDKKWRVKEYSDPGDAAQAERLSKEMGIPYFLAETLVKRGIREKEEAERFFHPSVRDFCDPFLFEEMETAVQRILDASEEGERVTVFGDYDADGITATAIVYHFLTHYMEINADYYIPNRFDEGYGLSVDALEMIAERGATLVVTVDCGIVSIAEVDRARELGIDVIVTDHHRCGDAYPDAVAVIDPVRPDCGYPCKALSGAGVAYKLISALAEAIGLDPEAVYAYLPVAALGTIGDAVPLVGENRIIASQGMEKMKHGRWLGIKNLMEAAGLDADASPLTVRSVAFALVPRINAAGRMGSGERALRLLLSETENDAARLAEELTNENKRRQELEAAVTAEAADEPAIRTSETDAVVVTAGHGWHHGVVGIVASRLVTKFKKPVLVFAYEEDGVTLRGSARSVPGFNIHAALSACEDCLIKFGGHEMAAGMSVSEKNIPALIAGLNRYAEQTQTKKYMLPEFAADALLRPEEVTLENAELLCLMQPCGEGNPEPVYIIPDAALIKCAAVGNTGSHLRLQFALGDGSPVSGIAFGEGGQRPRVSCIDNCMVLCKMTVNEWANRKNLSLQVQDLCEKPENLDSEARNVYNTCYSAEDYFSVSRKELVPLYNLIKNGYAGGFSEKELPEMLARLRQADPRYSWFRFFKGMEIFMELGLLRSDKPAGDLADILGKGRLVFVPAAGKLDLSQSAIYKYIAV